MTATVVRRRWRVESERRVRARLAATLAVVVVAGGCQQGGSDVDVQEAARELVAAAVAVLTTIAPEGEVTAGVEIRPCVDALNRETGEFVAELDSNTIVTGADLADASPDELDRRAREALREHGFAIDPDFPGGAVKGERGDDLGLVIVAQPPVGAVSASGSTGCRPPA